MKTATTKNTKTTNVVNCAINLVNQGLVRLHRDEDLPTVNFRDYAATQARYNLGNNHRFVDIVNGIFSQNGNFSNDFSVSITGLLAVAIALEGKTNSHISVADIQANGAAADSYFGPYFDEGTTNLIEYAFHPWTALDTTDKDELAASLYQRRIRKGVQESMDSQAAYSHLVTSILRRMKSNGGTFQPARDDYRQANSITG